MKQATSIMLVEDNRAYREVIEFALSHEQSMELTGSFGTAEIALRSLTNDENRSVPDLILLDLHLPKLSGLDALPRFLELAPDAAVIILTNSDSEADVVRAMTHGANGYLLKSSTVDEILQAILSVLDGGVSLDARIAKFILGVLRSGPQKPKSQPHLSAREIEILERLAKGKVKKEIGDELNISYFTVDAHIRSVYKKLNVSNAPSAVDKAYRTGIFS